ncbi:MAG: hypothetical protein SAL07_25260 [Oscillatoria sp. PMC 1051.18]|nr:hypothetical protein [Oscillatoria sp. PMC 1050.18]MEC5033216.1 hypothetical protein [Oscillatoria sp. PMC 1051.18]
MNNLDLSHGKTMNNLKSSVAQTTPNKQQSHKTVTNLFCGQRVYLYDNPSDTGTLIHPVEGTTPPRWTVKLDNGNYEAVNIDHITPITTTPETTDNQPQLQIDISELQQQIIALKQENQRLEQENQQLKEELQKTKQTLRRAKDLTPIIRPSLKRVLRLAKDACMEVKRTVKGWILKMGDKARFFRRLSDIWEILSQDNWYLSDIFPPHKLIPINKIQPPLPRKKPTPPEKQTIPLVPPSIVQLWRKMGLPKC